MAKALMCDNCKVYFSYKVLRYGLDKPTYEDLNNIAFSFTNENGQRLYRAYDICPECMKKVKDVLSGVERKVEP